MTWAAFLLMLASTVVATGTHLLKPAKRPTPLKVGLTVISFAIALAAAIVAVIAMHDPDAAAVPFVLVVTASVVFAVAIGSPYTELVFHLAANHQARKTKSPAGESPLRGGLWIGLLERTAFVCTLWANWPEGIAVILAIKGLGRFSELKDHNAAEQFILGTFSSSLCAAGAYGLGLMLLG
ncbi:hypothetical protein [Glutamicibacter creatinolyticus]|uniref:hypothetical protein n=1 Tax=Glutamicibacter creatinolyticus TaxID=162496 RepID=UPI003B97F86E